MVSFTVLTLVFNLLGAEVTPFFVWGMYSEKEKPVQQYEILKTTINDSVVINPYDYPATDTRFYLYTPLAWYKKIKDNNNQDPTGSFLQTRLSPTQYDKLRFLQASVFNNDRQQQHFLPWYARYLQQVTHIPIHTLRVDVVKVHYSDQNLVVDSILPFASWERP